MVLAENGDEVVGFAGVYDHGDLTYLADAFVHPDRVGRGIGRAILEAILSDSAVRATFASSDPRALPLYARFGMRPIMPLLYLSGTAEAVNRIPLDHSNTREVSLEPDLDVVIDLDAEASGRRRPLEHEFLLTLPGTSALIVRTGHRATAYGYVRLVVPEGANEPEAFIGPCGGQTEDDLALITEAAIHHAAHAASPIHLPVFGLHPGFGALLQAGFRIDGQDMFMASHPGLLDGRRYAPSPEFG